MSEMFTCAYCGGRFEKGWSDEEAAAEAAAAFSAVELEDTAVICDDCYGPFMVAMPGIRAEIDQEAAAAGLSLVEFMREQGFR